jgi:hypothetical protein
MPTKKKCGSQFALAAPIKMDCLSDIVWDFNDEGDMINDEFCASNGSAGRYVALLGASLLRSQDWRCVNLRPSSGANCLSTEQPAGAIISVGIPAR